MAMARQVINESFTDGFIAPVAIETLGNGATLKSTARKFSVKVAGGSCGSCGQADAVSFYPATAPLTGNFVTDLEFVQDGRTAVDGSQVRSGIYLEMKVNSPDHVAGSVSVSLTGDFRSNGTEFHGATGMSFIGNALAGFQETAIPKTDVSSGAWTMSLSRSGSMCTIRLLDPAGVDRLGMAPVSCSTEPLIPAVVLFSGSGGDTAKNGTYGASLKRLRLTAD
ncbi:hypothetical protein KAK06_04240 [Ideonella sp. 4Y11]|uniref:Uncharacterized protein n=2 Tax=Ideonella aquatica TaxID=2824119 RepID=A0A940YG92_9BURK|nr:hypothetical protein [Ideonella aquatica]